MKPEGSPKAIPSSVALFWHIRKKHPEGFGGCHSEGRLLGPLFFVVVSSSGIWKIHPSGHAVMDLIHHLAVPRVVLLGHSLGGVLETRRGLAPATSGRSLGGGSLAF